MAGAGYDISGSVSKADSLTTTQSSPFTVTGGGGKTNWTLVLVVLGAVGFGMLGLMWFYNRKK